MVDAVIKDRALERLNNMILTNNLIEGLRTVTPVEGQRKLWKIVIGVTVRGFPCLLYTSDAADE